MHTGPQAPHLTYRRILEAAMRFKFLLVVAWSERLMAIYSLTLPEPLSSNPHDENGLAHSLPSRRPY